MSRKILTRVNVIGYKIDKCPYCGDSVTLKSSEVIYSGKDYGLAYICDSFPRCDSYVGVHKGTTEALGRLANDELRRWKKEAHKYFDYLWKYKRDVLKHPEARNSAYEWLSKQLNIPLQETHIGWFDVGTCKKVVDICVPLFEHLQKKGGN